MDKFINFIFENWVQHLVVGTILAFIIFLAFIILYQIVSLIKYAIGKDE